VLVEILLPPVSSSPGSALIFAGKQIRGGIENLFVIFFCLKQALAKQDTTRSRDPMSNVAVVNPREKPSQQDPIETAQ